MSAILFIMCIEIVAMHIGENNNNIKGIVFEGNDLKKVSMLMIQH